MKTPTFPIVCVGASAGGLSALKDLFQNLPNDSGAGFVVIQHLDPIHESLTAEILSRSTKMPTAQVSNGMAIQPNNVYVIPPNAYLTLNDGCFELKEPVLQHGLRMPIDIFLLSLSKQSVGQMMAIIVSGTGNDGALGLRAIKGSGGVVLAQTPDNAEYDGMPRSAIATGLVDIVCPVKDMAGQVVEYLKHPYVIDQTVSPDSDTIASDDDKALSAILAHLLIRTGHDFRVYKRGTLKRRIARRMGIHNIDTMAEYLTLVRDKEGEATKLFKDLLISVTAFFRDADAFKALDENALSALVDSKQPDEPIRVWVPGCATGEEAYSIAMLLIERLEEAHKYCPVQVFASDIDDAAISVARTGLYPENVTINLSPKRIQQFFTQEDGQYRVNKSLREMITFATQNLIADPPFSNLDLVSCRNLLIYLKATEQRKVLALFHFALRDNGYLFLGHSETAAQQDNLFEPLEKRSRVYQRVNQIRSGKVDLPSSTRTLRKVVPNAPIYSGVSDQVRLNDIVHRHLLQQYAPAAVLINQKYQILYFSGPTGDYLEQPAGVPTQDLLSLARQGLRANLRTALKKIVAEPQVMTVDDCYVIRGGLRVVVNIALKPLMLPSESTPVFLITFEDASKVLPQPSSSNVLIEGSQNTKDIQDSQHSLIEQLQSDLKVAQENLQCNAEEFESANEELQAANEEVMSANEEMQSTNEELETSKEELQSMNEELSTVNSQLKDKLEELANINDDLENLFICTDIATLFVSSNLKIERFTPATKALFNLISSDTGRSLGDIRPKFKDDGLIDSIQQVLTSLMPAETEVVTESGHYYLQRIIPYRTFDNQITGVAITFVDITERKRAEKKTQRLAMVLRDSNDAVTVYNLEGNIIAWNRGAERMYGWSEQEALGMNVDALMLGNERKTAKKIIKAISQGEDMPSVETQRLNKSGASLDVWITFTPLLESGEVVAVATTERDITGIKSNEVALRESEENFRALVESAPDALVIVDADGKVELANVQAEHLFGYNKKELVGKEVEELMPERYRSEHTGRRQQFFADPKVRKMGACMELYAMTKEGEEIPIEVSLSPIVTKKGSVVCAAVRDMTDRKRAEEEVRKAKAIAEAALATKSRFLATASHDLRQPLQSLNLLNKALRKSVDTPDVCKMLEMQHESLEGMGLLLNSLLDIAKLESGTISHNISDIRVQPIFDHIRDEFEGLAKEKKLLLTFDQSEAVVRTDPGLLAQLIQNLVANAIHYTEKGFVHLGCTVAGKSLRIEVRDSGIGIPKDQLGHIFDEFHQINCDSQRKCGSLGLGLSIVQRIAQLLGTQVDVKSEVGVGSVFAVTLSVTELKPVEPEEHKQQAKSNEPTKGVKRILFVDDDSTLRNAAMALLSMEEGYDVKVASSPKEAYSILNKFSPDLVVTDFHLMHEDTGIDIIHAVRKRSKRLTPAILLTGDTSASMNKVELENIQLMTKPIDADELLVATKKSLLNGH